MVVVTIMSLSWAAGHLCLYSDNGSQMVGPGPFGLQLRASGIKWLIGYRLIGYRLIVYRFIGLSVYRFIGLSVYRFIGYYENIQMVIAVCKVTIFNIPVKKIWLPAKN